MYVLLYILICPFCHVDMILSVIEKLSSLDQTSTELFRDILVKYGPQLEEDNPGKMHIIYSRHYFFVRRHKLWFSKA